MRAATALWTGYASVRVVISVCEWWRCRRTGDNTGRLSTARGDVVVVLDADLQDPPEEIPRLLQALGQDDGVVFGRRTSRFESRMRHATSFLFKRILRVVSGSRIPKETGMYFAASSPHCEGRRAARVGTTLRAASSRPDRIPTVFGRNRQGDPDRWDVHIHDEREGRARPACSPPSAQVADSAASSCRADLFVGLGHYSELATASDGVKPSRASKTRPIDVDGTNAIA